MNIGNWTKLYRNTIYSTIWQEPPGIRVVWITMLMLADSEGYVGASVPGLAAAANVDLGVAEAALGQFKMPDKYSRSRQHDGRRIVDAPGGWHILNFLEHRNGAEDQREKWARQKRLQRASKKRVTSGLPLSGERAFVAAEQRGDYEGAAAIAAAGLPACSGPETASESSGFKNGSNGGRGSTEPPTESGRMVDGEWVPD